jgi:hypothetical protein
MCIGNSTSIKILSRKNCYNKQDLQEFGSYGGDGFYSDINNIRIHQYYFSIWLLDMWILGFYKSPAFFVNLYHT